MTTRIILTVCTVVFVGIIGYAYLTLPYQTPTPIPTATQTTNTTVTQPATSGTTGTATNSGTQSGGTTSSGISMATVAKHNSGSSCWTTISGKVYDLTAWINQHPGGADAILSLCGIDGTAAFDAQHGGQGKPERELASLYISALAQ